MSDIHPFGTHRCPQAKSRTVTGSQNNVGPIAGLPAGPPTLVTTGLAHDDSGTLFVQDVVTDAIYSGTPSGVSLLHSLPFDANFNQGITIDPYFGIGDVFCFGLTRPRRGQKPLAGG